MKNLFSILLILSIVAFGLCYASESVDIEPLKVSHVTTVVEVGTNATKLPSSPLVDRRVVLIQNLSTSVVYIGNANVTADSASTGGHVLAAQYDTVVLDFGSDIDIYGIVASSTADLVIWEAR